MRDEIRNFGCYVQADPYPWPYNGDLRPDNTALVAIDMQTDFCGVGGYVDKMGYDVSLTRAPIGPITRLLSRSPGPVRYDDGRPGRLFITRCRVRMPQIPPARKGPWTRFRRSPMAGRCGWRG